VAEDLLGLSGRVAVVHGGGGNIGRATTMLLARAGAHVAVVDVDGDAAARVAADASKLGPEAWAATVDGRDAAAVEWVVDAVVDRWGRLDTAVHLVGGGSGEGAVLETPDSTFAAVLELNLLSTLWGCRAAARAMQRQGGGSIVNIASPAALRAAPGMAAYGASKAAIVNLSATLAVELAPHGIRVNVVVPAFVGTESGGWGGDAARQEAIARRAVPMGRTTRASEVAGAIVCFASQLTGFCTGQVLVCDGGRLLTNPIFAAADAGEAGAPA